MAGNKGNAHRKQYSLTGTTVITAARIEQLNKPYSSQFLISKCVKGQLKSTGIEAKSLGEVTLKGIEHAQGILQLK